MYEPPRRTDGESGDEAWQCIEFVLCKEALVHSQGELNFPVSTSTDTVYVCINETPAFLSGTIKPPTCRVTKPKHGQGNPDKNQCIEHGEPSERTSSHHHVMQTCTSPHTKAYQHTVLEVQMGCSTLQPLFMLPVSKLSQPSSSPRFQNLSTHPQHRRNNYKPSECPYCLTRWARLFSNVLEPLRQLNSNSSLCSRHRFRLMPWG